MDTGSVQTTQRCSNCGEHKPATLAFFYAAKRLKSGLMGWCKACFSRLKRGEHVPKVPLTPEETFWKHVVVRDGCWGWTGRRHVFGYGMVAFEKTRLGAHAFSWRIHRGDPGDKFVLHKCDNTECSNPEHLFLGTQLENMRDKCTKGRQARGSTSGKAKIREPQAAAVLDLLAAGWTALQAARQVGVSFDIAADIRRGRTWRHVAEDRLREAAIERNALCPPELL